MNGRIPAPVHERAAGCAPAANLLGTAGILCVVLLVGCQQDKKRCKLSRQGGDPINIDQEEGEMLLPKTVGSAQLIGAVDIQITASAILVRGKPVTAIKNGKVDAATKRDGPDGYFIDPLFKALKAEADKLRADEKQGAAPFRGEALIATQKGTPYRILAEVLYTANQAEFKTYTFAIVKTPQ